MSKLSICFCKWFWYFQQYIVSEQLVWPEKNEKYCAYSCAWLQSFLSNYWQCFFFSIWLALFLFPWWHKRLFSFPLQLSSSFKIIPSAPIYRKRWVTFCLAKACKAWIFEIESIPDNYSKGHMCNILHSAVRFCIIQRPLFLQGSQLRELQISFIFWPWETIFNTLKFLLYIFK